MAGHIKTRKLNHGSISFQARIPSPANGRREVVKTFRLKEDAMPFPSAEPELAVLLDAGWREAEVPPAELVRVERS